MVAEPLVVRPCPARDPGGTRLNEVLDAHLRCERAEERRRIYGALLGLSSAVLWPLLILPADAAPQARYVAVRAWPLLLMLYLCALGRERRWLRRRAAAARDLAR